MTPFRKILAVGMLGVALPLFAQTQAPAAPAQPAAQNQVVQWQPGGATLMNKQDQMKVLEANDVKIAATMVNLSKQTTAARIVITNTSPAALDTSLNAFSVEIVKPKPQTVAPVPADKLGKKIRELAAMDAQHLEKDTGSMDRGGEGVIAQDERTRLRLVAAQEADYLQSTAFPATLQPNFQTIGHVYFPYLKADELVLRITVGGMTYEFPFNKKEIRNDFAK